MSDILYKYRGINNFEFLVDILVNNRLYACHFSELNDPMEGIYYYHSKDYDQLKNYIERIMCIKNDLYICSLSGKRNDPLMWTHYAQEERGINLGVKVINNNIEKVEYISSKLLANQNFNIHDDDAAKKILKSKLNAWKYENEKRVFTSEHYVDIKIHEIIFGSRIDTHIKNLITKIANKFNETIQFYQKEGESISLVDNH